MKRPIFTLAALGPIALAGCGGGRPSESGGRLAINVAWPAPTRLIPSASNSIKVEVFDGARRVAFRIINRPAASATFTGLPVANLLLKATAFPSDPGDPTAAGVIAQASGSLVTAVQAGDNPAVSVTMGSTIDRIEVNADSVVVNGPTKSLTATAFDASGSVVLVTPAAFAWQSSNPTSVTVTQTGVVAGVAAGVAVITARDTESNKSGSAPVTASAEGGTVNVTVNNPPTGARSVKIEVTNGAQTLAGRTLAWATGGSISDSLTGIQAGTHIVTATAYSQDSGGGAALGSASGPVNVPSLGSDSITLNIASLVAAIRVVPDGPTVMQGQGVTLGVEALDAAANPIGALVNTGFGWASSNTGRAAVSAAGVVSALTPGDADITATDPRTAAADSTTVHVTSSAGSAGGVVR